MAREDFPVALRVFGGSFTQRLMYLARNVGPEVGAPWFGGFDGLCAWVLERVLRLDGAASVADMNFGRCSYSRRAAVATPPGRPATGHLCCRRWVLKAFAALSTRLACPFARLACPPGQAGWHCRSCTRVAARAAPSYDKSLPACHRHARRSAARPTRCGWRGRRRHGRQSSYLRCCKRSREGFGTGHPSTRSASARRSARHLPHSQPGGPPLRLARHSRCPSARRWTTTATSSCTTKRQLVPPPTWQRWQQERRYPGRRRIARFERLRVR
jgi:hypothetical protein